MKTKISEIMKHMPLNISRLRPNMNVEGFENSGGRSQNVWVRVETKNMPIQLMKNLYSKSGSCCIKTEIDSFLRSGDYLPTHTSATFKSATDDYSYIVENIAMKPATALDIETSFNYIVSFDKTKYKKITDNYKGYKMYDQVKPYGLVSTDFLKDDEVLYEFSDLIM